MWLFFISRLKCSCSVDRLMGMGARRSCHGSAHYITQENGFTRLFSKQCFKDMARSWGQINSLKRAFDICKFLWAVESQWNILPLKTLVKVRFRYLVSLQEGFMQYLKTCLSLSFVNKWLDSLSVQLLNISYLFVQINNYSNWGCFIWNSC